MRKIVILENNNGRLANQLWYSASIYAYCIEKGFKFEDYAFFRYWHYFEFTISNQLIKLFFGDFYRWHKNIKFTKLAYLIYVKILKFFLRRRLVEDGGQEFLLPPTVNYKEKQVNILRLIELDDHTRYFCGWLFRNPVGLNKYYNDIKKYFKPKEVYYSEIIKLKNQLKEKYKLIVGVHIRQGDYRIWQGGKLFFSCSEVADILKDYLCYQKQYGGKETVFVICSDEQITLEEFHGLNVVLGPGKEITDLYMLAETDLIIGSNSTYGTWASYYGQIPFYCFSKEPINWSLATVAV